MRRYAVFVFDPGNPEGGWGDFMESFDTEEEAKNFFRIVVFGMVQIVDLHVMRVIKKKLRRPYASNLN